MLRLTLNLVVSLALFVGCTPSSEELADGDDPIAALSSTAQSSRYGMKYWSEQRDGETEVWADALAFCEPAEAADYPNCKTVRTTRFHTRSKEPSADPRTAPGFGDF